MMRPFAQRVQQGQMGSRCVWWWRDDLFALAPSIAGNKARKFDGLHRILSSPGHDFAQLASYGGPQSNSMLALSLLARAHQVPFIYYCKKLPVFLSTNRPSTSNLEKALQSGMELQEVTTSEYERLVSAPKTIVPPAPVEGGWAKKTCWVPQGGAFAGAEAGVEALVGEIVAYVRAATGEKASRPWKLVVASGTGTMALFAARCMARQAASTRCEVEVVAIPCVGSSAALQHEMASLDAASGDCRIFPTVLGEASGATARVFAAPCAEHLGIWTRLRQESGIDFDLVYAPRAWEILLDSKLWKEENCNIIYYCCGGHEGNESQLGRYRHSGLLKR